MKSNGSLFAFVLLVYFSASLWGQTPDDYPFVNRANLKMPTNGFVEITVGGDKREIDKLWREVTDRCELDDTFLGRMVIECFDGSDWIEVSDLKSRPARTAKDLMVVDFACDYIDQRSRQDYWTLDSAITGKMTEKEVADFFSASRRPLLSTAPLDRSKQSLLFAKTLDFQMTRNFNDVLYVSLPKAMKRVFPTLVDTRAIGMFSFNQWKAPTSLEEWIQATPHFLPVKIEQVDYSLVSAMYFQSEGPIVRSYVIDTGISRIVEYTEYPVKLTDDPFHISIPKLKTFHNKMRYDSKGRLVSFAMGCPGVVYRGTVVFSDIGKEVPVGYFMPKAMCGESTKIELDSSVKDLLELLNDLEVAHLRN